jgi:Secretion system C-terminal sorting domain
MKYFTILVNFIFISNLIVSQNLYVNVNKDIYRMENNFELTKVVSVQNFTPDITDIAISPLSIMYGITREGEIIEINLQNGHVDSITHLPFGDGSVTLVCDNTNHLLTLSSAKILYSYDLTDHKMQLINYLGDNSPGDISFYQGNIVFQGFNHGDIMAYNIESSELVRVICRPSPFDDLFGMSNLFDNCSNERLFATGSSNNFYKLDIEGNSIEFIKHFEVSTPEGYGIFGMASTSEHLASDCNYNFENVDCGTSKLNEISEQNSTKIFPNPADNIIYIESNEIINSIMVFNSMGMLIKTVDTELKSIDVSELPSGIYYFNFATNRKSFVTKVFKR